MVEVHIGPTAAGMTGLAALAVMPVVVVVFEVAGDTGRVELVGKRILAVATVTALLGMFAINHKVGITIVIEAGIGPARRRMTIPALLSAAAIMCVVSCMTVVAIRVRVLEYALAVTIGAGRV